MQEVPNLKGFSYINLKKIIQDQNLRFEIIDSSKFTPNLPPLSVIDHHPHAGQMVKKIVEYTLL